MALFKICRGSEVSLPSALTDGCAYFCTDTTNFYIDHKDSTNVIVRSKISGAYAEKLRAKVNNETVELGIEDIIAQLNTKANASHTHDDIDREINNINEMYGSISVSVNNLERNTVPTTRKINGHDLSEDITFSASDVGAYTKTEIDSYVLITTAEIDEICGQTIMNANEVEY